MSGSAGTALCVIVRTESPRLREWLEFHRLAGVRRFYVYDCDSTGAVERTIRGANLGEGVTRVPWSQSGSPQRARNHCLLHYGFACRWIGFLETNDYLFALQGGLSAALAAARDAPAVAVACVPFGWGLLRPRRPLIAACPERLAGVPPDWRWLVNASRFPIRALANGGFGVVRPSAAIASVPAAAQLPVLRVNRYHFSGGPALPFFERFPLRGSADLAIARYVPSLVRALGWQPDMQRPRQVCRRRPAAQANGVPPREVVIVGMQRSGNHAVIHWLLSGLPANWIFYNGIRLEFEPFAQARLGQSPHFDPRARRRLGEDISAGNFAGTLVYSLEEYSVAAVGACLRRRGPLLAGGASRVVLLILRDPANLFASRLRQQGVSEAAFGHLPLDSLHARHARDRWIEHAREFLGATRHLPNLVPVSYNRFVADAEYRLALARRLAITPEPQAHLRVTGHGGGSSFSGTRFDGRADRMRVFDRQRSFAGNPLFRSVTDHPRVRALAAAAFI